jgi:3-oxoadipate enol-lactonase
VIAGASMGGCVALQFAATHSERARGLGLIDTTAWYGPSARQNWEERADRALQSGLKGMVEFQVTRWFSDGFRGRHPDVVNRCVETFVRNDVQAFAATCRMLGAFDGRTLLARLRVPTAIVVGEEDYATPPAMAEALHRAIAGSTLTAILGARHLTPVEQPDVVAHQLIRLLAS